MSDNNSNDPIEMGADMDYAEHNKTYDMFMGLTKWGTISVVVILILMAIFLL